MQYNLLPVERADVFWKLMALTDALGATLAAWRDVQAFCLDRDIDLVPDEEIIAWHDIAWRTIAAMHWLGRLDWGDSKWPSDCERRMHEKLTKEVIEHINGLMRIQDRKEPR
jgi:hypothetical protein